MNKYNVIVLSGGGSKAIAHLGVLHYYEEIGIFDMKYIEEARGTSAGAIISLLLICGYKAMDIMGYIYNIKHFMVENKNSIWDILKKKGLIPIELILIHLEKMVNDKFGYIPTMLELYKATGKTLIMPTINITKNRKEYISYKTYPNLNVVKAASMSSNLPFIFQEILHENNSYLDGGLADNFPSEGIPSTKKVLGIVITGTDAAGTDISFLNFLYRTVMFPVNELTLHRSKNLGSNFTIIYMNINDVPVLELEMTGDRKMSIFMKGYSSAKIEDTKLLLKVDGWEEDPWSGWTGVNEW